MNTKRMTGFIKSDELSKWLDDLLKYYDAKDLQFYLKIKKILSKELFSIRE